MDILHDVLSKAAREADSPRSEILAEQGLATTAVETLVALERRLKCFDPLEQAHSR